MRIEEVRGELPMLEQNFQSVYEKFKLQFFRRLFSQVREREGSLSAMEAFSVEVIHELDAPTISASRSPMRPTRSTVSSARATSSKRTPTPTGANTT